VITNRLLETVAMTIIGDSVLCVLSPRRHISLWLDGPRWWQHAWSPLVRQAGLTRALGVLGLGFGVWLAWRQQPAIRPPVRKRVKRWAGDLVEALQ
jgi:hypothetical protein